MFARFSDEVLCERLSLYLAPEDISRASCASVTLRRLDRVDVWHLAIKSTLNSRADLDALVQSSVAVCSVLPLSHWRRMAAQLSTVRTAQQGPAWTSLVDNLPDQDPKSKKACELPMDGLAASSTDEAHESLKNVLTGDPRRYWSSSVEPSPSAPELLVFALNRNRDVDRAAAAVGEIEFWPHSEVSPGSGGALSGRVRKTYGWDRCQVRLWRAPAGGDDVRMRVPANMTADEDLSCLGELAFDSGQLKCFGDAAMEALDPDDVERDVLEAALQDRLVRVRPPGGLTVADFMTINFSGRLLEARQGGGYYFCVQRVRAVGIVARVADLPAPSKRQQGQGRRTRK